MKELDLISQDMLKSRLMQSKMELFKGKKFTFSEGKKYLKVIMNDYDDRTGSYRSGGAHCFIDKNTDKFLKQHHIKHLTKESVLICESSQKEH